MLWLSTDNQWQCHEDLREVRKSIIDHSFPWNCFAGVPPEREGTLCRAIACGQESAGLASRRDTSSIAVNLKESNPSAASFASTAAAFAASA